MAISVIYKPYEYLMCKRILEGIRKTACKLE